MGTDEMTISKVKLGESARTGSVDFREEYNKLMAKFNAKTTRVSVFGNGFAGVSVNKAATDFDG